LSPPAALLGGDKPRPYLKTPSGTLYLNNLRNSR
jgi:hypothetical protein